MEKIDAELEYQLYRWRTRESAEQTDHAPEDRVGISVRFTGDLGPIQGAGFVVESVIGNIAFGRANLADIERIAALDEVVKIESDTEWYPQLNVSVPEIHGNLVWDPPLSLDGTGVIVGIVEADSGIDIFHHAFRNPDDSTRILSIWDQTLPTKNPPAGFASTGGVEFSIKQINDALKNPNQSFQSQDLDGHGTHVAGTAAGNGSQAGSCRGANTYIGVAKKADIIIAKCNKNAHDVIQGVRYIFQCATNLNNKPAVVNLSLGGHHGAHDGTTNTELALDKLVGDRGRVIVVSAGNDGDGDQHVYSFLKGNAPITLRFRVDPHNQGDRFDIWYSGAARLAFKLTPPSGLAYQNVPPGTPGHNLTGGPPGGDVVWAQSKLNDHPDPLAPSVFKHFIYVKIDPGTGSGEITSGTWEMTFQETAGATTDYDVWSKWKAPNQDPPDTRLVFLDGAGVSARTVTIPGTANNVITVGSYDPRDGSLATDSSRGAPPGGRLFTPDICAPGVGITAPASRERPHWYICDCCLEFYVPEEGTSCAAPHVTGVVALMLQRNPNLTYEQVRNYLTSSARLVAGQTLPNDDWGYGKVDALAACNSVPPVGGGGGSGGGGAGGAHFRPPVPDGAMASEYAGIPSRLHALEQRFGKHPLWQLLAALVSTHFDEVSRLINTNRRVGATWRRLHGPRLMREALHNVDEPDVPLIPTDVADRPLHACIERWLAILARYSSARLQADIERYRTLILALPGATLRDLEAMEVC